MKKDEFLDLKPMLLQEIAKPFNDKDYIYEIKFDGFRALIYINKKEIIIKSRNGIILNEVFPELEKIKDIIKIPCIIDGEIIYLDNGLPNIRPLQERMRTKDKIKKQFLQDNYPALFIAFDILNNGKSLLNTPLIKRKNILEKLPENEVFQKAKFYKEKGKELFQVIKKANMEGIVAKKINSCYYPGKRVNFWLKIKNFQSDYFYIGGYALNKNNTISLFLGEKTKEGFKYVGKIAISNKNDIYYKVLKSKVIKKSPFINYSDSSTNFLNPKLEIFIYYTEKTKNNMLRHPKI